METPISDADHECSPILPLPSNASSSNTSSNGKAGVSTQLPPATISLAEAVFHHLPKCRPAGGRPKDSSAKRGKTPAILVVPSTSKTTASR